MKARFESWWQEEQWRTALLAAMLVFAPLIRASNRPIPLLILELLALILLLSAWRRVAWHELPRLVRWGLVGLVALPLIQWLPVPFELWSLLPGHDRLGAALAAEGLGEGWRSLSVVGGATEQAFLALLPPLAVFFTAWTLPTRVLRQMVVLVIGMGVIQALLGLLQYGAGPDSLFALGNPFAGHSASGFHANRDHFAGMMEMLLPLALALTAARFGHGARTAGFYRNWRHRFSHWVDWRANQTLLYGLSAVVMFLALVFTRSRTGVVLGMLLILLAAFAFARRLGGRRAAGLAGTLAVGVLVLAAEIGLAPVLQRFVLIDPLQDARWSIFQSTFEGVAHFLPLGSGAGTFPWVFPLFQGTGYHAYVNHAHNDYLEWALEGGAVAVGVVILLATAYLLHWRKVWHSGEWRTFRFMQVGAGLGLLLLGLHGWVDFNFRIPANAVYFAFLAALFFHPGEADRELPVDRSLRRLPSTHAPPRQILGPALEPVPNPLEEGEKKQA